MTYAKISILFSAMSFAALSGCQQAPTQPTPQERIVIAKAEEAAAKAKMLAANAQLSALHAASTQTPQSKGDPKTAGENCVDGAVKAVKVAAIGTTVGCVIDLFVTGGAICAAVIASAPTTVPMTVGSGCAIGAVNTPESAAYAGQQVTIPQQSQNGVAGATAIHPHAAPQ